MREYYEKLYDNKLDNLKKMDKFLEIYKLPKPKQEEIENLNIPTTSNEIESVTTKLPTNKKSSITWLPRGILPFKEESIPILLKLFQKIEKGGKKSKFIL